MLKKSSQRKRNCEYLNNKCIQSSTFHNLHKTKNFAIGKTFLSNEEYAWEINVYLELLKLDANITPLIDTGPLDQNIVYYLDNMKSMRHQLQKDNSLNLLLNELFSFVKSFRDFGYVHGNLHIDNIYVRELNFCVIDLSNSYLQNEKAVKFRRRSFLGENDDLIKYKQNFTWDLFTLYISLKMYFASNSKDTTLLDSIVALYIPSDILMELLIITSDIHTQVKF